MLLTFLRSQARILKAEIKAREGYVYNDIQRIEVSVKKIMLIEIKSQIREIEKTGKIEWE